ncbi:GDSL-type esterase/lipase family protein [Brevibacillus agri]|uniref:GDSL-type esterase/lipase family protein n=1 Tax=Brevibacillus agri TaxID=51101 RepID=UPI0024BF1A09|nr:GDSL-type esterase/lipase family protein [Brevibacillus agri]WHX29377.1 GDSL-type esterase/lipase family protein [Brevibacillus agri]
MNEKRPALIKPGFFSIEAAADRRRNEFDYHNEALLYHQQRIDFLFFGDSITHWWDVATFFGRSGQVLVNRGIGGDTTEHARRRFAADVVQLKPRYAVILIGINNTWALDAFSPEDRLTPEEIRHQVTTDVEAMVKMATEHGIQPILCSLLPTCMDRYSRNHERNELVVAINARFQEIAEETGAIYVDYHSELTEADGITLRSELADDGLHPHVIGYRLMAAVLQKTLRERGITLGPDA